jgi:hypothetical protein
VNSKEETMAKDQSRLSVKHGSTPPTSKLTNGEAHFLKKLGLWLQSYVYDGPTDPKAPKDYGDILNAGLQAQVYNSAGNCRRWCYDDDNDPYCCG